MRCKQGLLFNKDSIKATVTAYTRPFNELKTHALAKKPTPTVAKPQPATSLYLKIPIPISTKPITTIIKVAQAKTVFLFILKNFDYKCTTFLFFLKK